MTDILAHLRRSAIPYAALLIVLVAGLGGGYALAASKTKTITVCADKKTGILHLKTRGKCKRGQTRVIWNQKGAQGPQGVPGATGPQGASAVSVWANVTNAGSVAFGQGISVQHLNPGVYEVTITDATCADRSNAPVVSVSDTSPPGGQSSSGAFPVAWYQSTGLNQQFRVYTGVVPVPSGGGSYTGVTLSDHSFDVMDACM
jgi:hypothetical protein